MGYDHRHRMAGQFDNRLKQAQTEAKAKWGAGWERLSDEQQNGAVALALVGLIAQIDFDDAFRGRLTEPGVAEKLLQKLVDLTYLCGKALV